MSISENQRGTERGLEEMGASFLFKAGINQGRRIKKLPVASLKAKVNT